MGWNDTNLQNRSEARDFTECKALRVDCPKRKPNICISYYGKIAADFLADKLIEQETNKGVDFWLRCGRILTVPIICIGQFVENGKIAVTNFKILHLAGLLQMKSGERGCP